MRVNNVEITPETIIATRFHFADIHIACILDALDGTTRVNNLEKYIQYEKAHIARLQEGSADHSLTFVQRALWIQTGECVAILS